MTETAVFRFNEAFVEYHSSVFFLPLSLKLTHINKYKSQHIFLPDSNKSSSARMVEVSLSVGREKTYNLR